MYVLKFELAPADEDEQQKYSELKQFTHVSWHSASGKFNVAVVDGGPLNVAHCVQEISSSLRSLTAVMIQDEHFRGFCEAFCLSVARDFPLAEKPKLDLPGCRHLTSIVHTIDWTLGTSKLSTDGVQPVLRSARRAGVVLFIKSSSLELSLDILRQSPNIGQAVLLNPSSKNHERYFQDWTRSSTVAFEFIPSSFPEGKSATPTVDLCRLFQGLILITPQ